MCGGRDQLLGCLVNARVCTQVRVRGVCACACACICDSGFGGTLSSGVSGTSDPACVAVGAETTGWWRGMRAGSLLPGRSYRGPHHPWTIIPVTVPQATQLFWAKAASAHRGGWEGQGFRHSSGLAPGRRQSQHRGDRWPRGWPPFFRAQGAVGPAEGQLVALGLRDPWGTGQLGLPAGE